LPEEAELETARRELREAIARHERERIPGLYAAVRAVEERVAATKRSLRGLGRVWRTDSGPRRSLDSIVLPPAAHA
jgi:hypothetical protein